MGDVKGLIGQIIEGKLTPLQAAEQISDWEKFVEEKEPEGPGGNDTFYPDYEPPDMNGNDESELEVVRCKKCDHAFVVEDGDVRMCPYCGAEMEKEPEQPPMGNTTVTPPVVGDTSSAGVP